jgi:hypothetical protein
LPDDGEVVLQAFPRLLGFVFNPVSFWFCRDRAGALIAVLAEVNNTFGGTHSYLLHHPDGSPILNGEQLTTAKAFHVSPFCRVEGGYRFRFQDDGVRLSASIDYDDGDGPLLRTALFGRLRPWTVAALLGTCLRMPLLTVGVVLRIHWQALKLLLKRVPFVGVTPTVVARGEEMTE